VAAFGKQKMLTTSLLSEYVSHLWSNSHYEKVVKISCWHNAATEVLRNSEQRERLTG